MRVLGLDISPHAVACVEMDTAFGRFEIRDMHERILAPTASASAALEAGQGLLQELQRKVERLVTAVPVEISTFRNLEIASKEKKAVRAALEFELEDDLPFEKENLHYDSAVLGLGNQSSFIHVSAVKKESFEIHLNSLLTHEIDPDLITSDAWAYRSLISRLQSKSENKEPVLLLGLEPDKTFFYFHDQNRPILYREVPFGVKTIAHFLKEKMGEQETPVDHWLKDVGVSGINEEVSNAIAEILETLLPELKQAELSARNSLKALVDQIWLTGEGALIAGLIPWLESSTGKRVSLFKPLSQLSPVHVNYSDLTEIRYAKALALAMSTVSIDKLNPINLRKGIFSKISSEHASTFDLIKKPLPYVAITLFVFLASKSIEYQYYKAKLTDTDETLKKATKSYFGNVSDSAARTYLADPAKLKKTIQADLTKERELSKLLTPNPNSPLDYLKNLSQKLGKELVLDLIDFNASTEKVSLTLQVSNAQMLAKVTETLDKNFGLKKGTSEEVSVEGRKLFKVIFTGTAGATKK